LVAAEAEAIAEFNRLFAEAQEPWARPNKASATHGQ
jgi:hypothetical protein